MVPLTCHRKVLSPSPFILLKLLHNTCQSALLLSTLLFTALCSLGAARGCKAARGEQESRWEPAHNGTLGDSIEVSTRYRHGTSYFGGM